LTNDIYLREGATVVRDIKLHVWGLEGVVHHVTVNEILGLLESKQRTKSIYRTMVDMLGLKESKERVKSIHRTVTDKLSFEDSITKVVIHIGAIIQGVREFIYKVEGDILLWLKLSLIFPRETEILKLIFDISKEGTDELIEMLGDISSKSTEEIMAMFEDIVIRKSGFLFDLMGDISEKWTELLFEQKVPLWSPTKSLKRLKKIKKVLEAVQNVEEVEKK